MWAWETAKVIHEQGLCLEEYLQQRAEYQSAVAWAWEKGCYRQSECGRLCAL